MQTQSVKEYKEKVRYSFKKTDGTEVQYYFDISFFNGKL